MVVVVVVLTVVPGVLPGLAVVRVSVIGVPLRSPVTTAFESAPRKELKSVLIFSTTLVLLKLT